MRPKYSRNFVENERLISKEVAKIKRPEAFNFIFSRIILILSNQNLWGSEMTSLLVSLMTLGEIEKKNEIYFFALTWNFKIVQKSILLSFWRENNEKLD